MATSFKVYRCSGSEALAKKQGRGKRGRLWETDAIAEYMVISAAPSESILRDYLVKELKLAGKDFVVTEQKVDRFLLDDFTGVQPDKAVEATFLYKDAYHLMTIKDFVKECEHTANGRDIIEDEQDPRRGRPRNRDGWAFVYLRYETDDGDEVPFFFLVSTRRGQRDVEVLWFVLEFLTKFAVRMGLSLETEDLAKITGGIMANSEVCSYHAADLLARVSPPPPGNVVKGYPSSESTLNGQGIPDLKAFLQIVFDIHIEQGNKHEDENKQKSTKDESKTVQQRMEAKNCEFGIVFCVPHGEAASVSQRGIDSGLSLLSEPYLRKRADLPRETCYIELGGERAEVRSFTEKYLEGDYLVTNIFEKGKHAGSVVETGSIRDRELRACRLTNDVSISCRWCGTSMLKLYLFDGEHFCGRDHYNSFKAGCVFDSQIPLCVTVEDIE